jgi:cytosine deaminase
MDPWYSLGTGDMLDVAHMGLHVAQMTSPDAMRQCYELVTTGPAAIMGLSDYGLRPGALASLVVLDAADPIDAIRRRPERLAVISKGRVVARTRPAETTLHLG